MLIEPWGGKLVDLVVDPEGIPDLRDRAARLPSIQLAPRFVCDLELLATGGFSPLDRFMSRNDLDSVLQTMRLTDGTLFPVPVFLPVDATSGLEPGQEVALRDSKNELLGILRVEEIFTWDPDQVAMGTCGTCDPLHPLVSEMANWGRQAISGPIEILQVPRHYDFMELRLGPVAVRERLEELGRSSVVAFQTRNPLHRVHEELTKGAIREPDSTLLLHPAVGLTKPGDVDHYTRVRTYMAVTAKHYPARQVLLSLIPLAMRMAGPREALWHALIRRNYGANAFVVGRDHASPGLSSEGKPFYAPYAAQELADEFSSELGVRMVRFLEMVYLPSEDRYVETDKVPPGRETLMISGSQVRDEYLSKGKRLPAWFTRPEVAAILHEIHPARNRQGVCLWFTGLSGAGKSTTAEILTTLILEHGRQVTLLDGDVVRTHLSKGLGFSREDRDVNIRRIGFVASEIVRHGGVAICAAVSPYRATRNEVRNLVGGDRFVEIFVDTPLEECERRDAKGMYAKARRGEIRGFTGIDDPYEPPENPEIALETVGTTAEANARFILRYLWEAGFIQSDPHRDSLKAENYG